MNGLVGTVVLQNNNADNLNLTTNANFTFDKSVVPGSTYSITVLTNPSGQICTASSNNGIISDANITSVVVTCSTDSYTVSGILSGVTGTLIIQNNGVDNLSLTTNSNFIFPSRVAHGSPYSITVFSQSVGQTCNISNPSGMIAAADVTNVSITCINSGYSIGGTIAGLTGTIILQNNLGDNLSLSANGSFTFTAGLINAATYSATILTQPSGQTCIAATNIGMVALANVTNVIVTCTSNSYTVGGSIVGLTGTVVLQDNLGDNLSRAANGVFTFATSVVNGAAYSVTVLTNPAGQTCSASTSSGTINAVNINTVSVTCSIISYTVGGSIAGLTGTVVLQDNLGDNLSLAANGVFTFVTTVANGSAYSVSVLTNPSGQTCTPSINTGTIAAANITAVVITCSNNSYTVGGSISGLTGTVVLQDNLGDNLSRAANGVFTFATSVVNGAAYSATVFTQPAGQICTASTNTGTILAANITTVSVTCVTTYTVGGTISGIIGTVILQNNLGDNLSRAANGAFTFSTGVVNTGAYSVTVLTQPANKTCVVTIASGIISAANITSVVVTCSGNANGILSSGSILNTLSALTGGVTTFTGSACAANTVCASGIPAYVDSATPSIVQFGLTGPGGDTQGITTDGINIYVADKKNQVIRQVVIATGATTTIAGNGIKALINATGTAASFNDPIYLVTDGINIYIGDSADDAIRQLNISTLVVTTLATDSVLLGDPKGMAIYNNNLYVSDNTGNGIRQINLSTGVVTTVIAAGISSPGGMALNGSDLYISEKTTDNIYKTTIGNWTVNAFVGTGVAGYTNGMGTAAQFKDVEGMISDGTNLFVADKTNNVIRKIVIATAVVTTLSGPSTAILGGYTNNTIFSSALFDKPTGIVSDGNKLYIMDSKNFTIRLIQ